MRRRRNTETKYSAREILNAFLTDARKSNFGNFRVEGETLLYRAQSSTDAPSLHDPKNFDAWRGDCGAKIRDLDGKLTDGEGKTVMLEALTAESTVAYMRLRIQYFETNLIALRVKAKDGTETYLGNSNILELVGRSVAYGNVSNNTSEVEIQREMRSDARFVMLPLSTLDKRGLDVSQVEIVQRGPVETVTYDERVGYGGDTQRAQRDYSPTVFRVGAKYFLRDLDRRELSARVLKPFLAETPRPVTSIGDAYAALVPQEVLDAQAKGLNVKQMGKWFFIPTQAPVIPALSVDERMLILGANSYSLDEGALKYITGQAKAERKDAEVERLMERVPRPLSLDKGFSVSSAIEVGGVMYCRSEVSRNGNTTLSLGGWHKPVAALSVEAPKDTGGEG